MNGGVCFLSVPGHLVSILRSTLSISDCGTFCFTCSGKVCLVDFYSALAMRAVT